MLSKDTIERSGGFGSNAAGGRESEGEGVYNEREAGSRAMYEGAWRGDSCRDVRVLSAKELG